MKEPMKVDHLFRNGGHERGYRCERCDVPEGEHPDPARVPREMAEAEYRLDTQRYRAWRLAFDAQKAWDRIGKIRRGGKRERARLRNVWQTARRREERARERWRTKHQTPVSWSWLTDLYTCR